MSLSTPVEPLISKLKDLWSVPCVRSTCVSFRSFVETKGLTFNLRVVLSLFALWKYRPPIHNSFVSVESPNCVSCPSQLRLDTGPRRSCVSFAYHSFLNGGRVGTWEPLGKTVPIA